MKKIYINNLLRYAQGGPNIKITKTTITAQDAFDLTEKELKRLNASIRSKLITDEHIGNSIFKNLRGETSETEIANFAKNHFTAGYYTFMDLRKRMRHEDCFDETGIKKYGFLIANLIHDIRIFAEYIGKKLDPDYQFFVGSKSNAEHSKFHYLGTNQLLYNCTYRQNVLDSKFAFILSAVSLRQTLELKMQRILGVADYFDLNGQKIFTNHYFFFEFVKDNKKHFDLTLINLKIIQKIFDFCNISVHKGIMPYYWQMFYALNFCDKLFFDADYDTRPNWNINSAVRINHYPELKQKLQDKLEDMFPKPKYKLEIQWITPEAQIL